ncbi:acyl-CoA dehydratase activase-related protein [Bacillota bacterium LX-D]|nr:acyl-CoA dehydratase activase-related protein [Bacillota bacterium LX-D]
MKVGIPRSLFYYYYYPLWAAFINELGGEIILSPPTSKKILNKGLSIAVDEICLPIKVFYGHVDYLIDKVDLLFIPRIVSVAPKEFICPKFMGLPDMVRQNFKVLPKVIDLTVDLSKNPLLLAPIVQKVGSYFTLSLEKINKAWAYALQQQRYFKKLSKEFVQPEEAFKQLNAQDTISKKSKNNKLTLGFLGHGYTIYDPFLSMELIDRLEKMNIKILTAESIDDSIINAYAANLPKKMYWTVAKKILGSTFYWLENKAIHGLVYLSVFGCGPDSLVVNMVQRYCHQQGLPFLNLTIDEHTGEAGTFTRIEAFLDMLEGGFQLEGNISAYGQSISGS